LQKQFLRLHNTTREPIRLVCEPWGEEITLLPDSKYQLAAEGPEGDYLEIEFGIGLVIVYGWPGSTLLVYSKGDQVLACRIPVPNSPPR